MYRHSVEELLWPGLFKLPRLLVPSGALQSETMHKCAILAWPIQLFRHFLGDLCDKYCLVQRPVILSCCCLHDCCQETLGIEKTCNHRVILCIRKIWASSGVTARVSASVITQKTKFYHTLMSAWYVSFIMAPSGNQLCRLLCSYKQSRTLWWWALAHTTIFRDYNILWHFSALHQFFTHMQGMCMWWWSITKEALALDHAGRIIVFGPRSDIGNNRNNSSVISSWRESNCLNQETEHCVQWGWAINLRARQTWGRRGLWSTPAAAHVLLASLQARMPVHEGWVKKGVSRKLEQCLWLKQASWPPWGQSLWESPSVQGQAPVDFASSLPRAYSSALPPATISMDSGPLLNGMSHVLMLHSSYIRRHLALLMFARY